MLGIKIRHAKCYIPQTGPAVDFYSSLFLCFSLESSNYGSKALGITIARFRSTHIKADCIAITPRRWHPQEHLGTMSVILPPSEFRGTPKTSVAGRIVIRRGPFSLNRREQAPTQSVTKGGKGKHGKRSASSEGNSKTEIHLLGGTDASEVLFGEAWAENASTLAREVELGKLYIISGARYVAKAPEYSTSRLMYYLRFEGRFASKSRLANGL